MTISSMTGFARSEGSDKTHQWFWEIRSVNGRGLDVRMRLATSYDQLEVFVRETIAKKISRGNIQINLGVKAGDQQPVIRINPDIVADLHKKASEVAASLNLDPPGLDTILQIRGAVETVEPDEVEDVVKARLAAMKSDFSVALEALVVAREEEGRRLAGFLNDQLDRIAELKAKASNAPSRDAEAIKARIAEQIDRVTSTNAELDPDRLHQEAVLIAAKADIQEELDRLDAHVAAARDLLNSSKPVGRKLDFLAQEFNRESNTLCSKSNHVDLTEIGLELKVVVDQMREQVQNIE